MQIYTKLYWQRLLGFAALAPWLILSNVSEAAAPEVKSIRLTNPTCEAEISLQPFVRLISFRLKDGKSHLLSFDSPNPVINGKPSRPAFVAGAKFWFAPEVAGSSRFGMLPGTPTQNGRDVLVHLEPDPDSKLQGTIRYTLDEHLPRITISSTLCNVGPAATETGCWWPVAFEPGGRMEARILPLPVEPVFRFVLWSYSAPVSDPACRISHDKVSLEMDRPFEGKPLFKVGFLSGEIAVCKPDCTYRLTALDPPPKAGQNYPHDGSPAIFYCDQRTGFCEAELSGPLARLQPGEETVFTFAISLEAPPTPSK